MKGVSADLLSADNNFRVAALAGSSFSQNQLGEIYLHDANIYEKYKVKKDYLDVKAKDTPLALPNLNIAVFLLQQAAKNGNPAAQGTLGDLYRQGIGVSQNFVLAYVWNNLSFSGQTKFNHNLMNSPESREQLRVFSSIRDKLYNSLTDNQKDEAQKISGEYEKLYSKSPNNLDDECEKIQSFISAKNALKLLEIFKRNMLAVYK